MSNLEKENQDFINELFTISKKIKLLYEEIYNLIINNKKTDEMVQKLYKLVQEENELYKKLKTDAIKINLVNKIVSIKENDFQSLAAREITVLENGEEINLIKKRIKNNLLKIFLEQEDKDIELNKEKVEIAINRDFINTLIRLIYEYLKTDLEKELKNKLQKLLLDIMFMHKNSESTAIILNFKPNDKLYWDAPVFAKCYKISEEDLNNLASEFGYDIFNEYINTIVAIDPLECENADLFEYTFKEIIIRASLLFIGKEEVQTLKDMMPLDIKTKKYAEELKKARERLYNVIDYFELDKSLPKVIDNYFPVQNKNVKLTYEDYETLEKLSQISKKILDIYYYLASLEINDQKDSELYRKNMLLLQNLLKEEKEIYEYLEGDVKIASEMFDYINDFNGYDVADTLTVIKNDDENELIKVRIFSKLDHILSTVPISDEEVFDIISGEDEENLEEEKLQLDSEVRSITEEEQEEFALLEEIDSEDADKRFTYEYNLDLEIIYDYLNTLLVILNSYLNNDYQKYRDVLIRYKYKIGYTFINLENDLITNNFNINYPLYWQSKLFVGFNAGDVNEYEILKNKLAVDIMFEQLEYLIDLFYNDLNDSLVYSDALIIKIILRTCLLFTNEKGRNDFYEALRDEVSEVEDITDKENVCKFISSCFNHLEKDEELPYRVEYRSL